MLKPDQFLFCPKCGAPMNADHKIPKKCSSCDFFYYNNPLPVVAALVELDNGVILVRERTWPEKMFGLVTGFVEEFEDPQLAIKREVEEELSVTVEEVNWIGNYPFEQMNQLLLAFHVMASGPITLSDELIDYKIILEEKLSLWPFGTGFAVKDWLELRSKKDGSQ